MASLEWDPNAEKAVDRVAAAGKTTNISLWEAAYCLSPAGLIQLEHDLHIAFQTRYKAEQQASRVVAQAIQEFLFDKCRLCQGHGEVLHSCKIVVCPDCGGNKVKRYSDPERARMMQLSYSKTKYLAHKIKWCLGWLGNLDRRTNVEMNVELRSD